MNTLLDPTRSPGFDGVRAAHAAISAIVPPTPLLALEHGGLTLWCKDESAQPMGAFKLRGAWHRLSGLSAKECSGGVVAFSSGNHAQGVAWAAQRLGIAAAIVMPSDAPLLKLEGTRAFGAEVVLYDRARDSREEIAARLAAERGSVLVPSFDDPWVIEGQGSCGLEAVEQFAATAMPPPDLFVAPCGGGGLAAGVALALPDARIAIAEPEGWDDMRASLMADRIEPVGANPPPTICDALMTPRVSSLTFDVLAARKAEAHAVSEREVIAAMRLAYDALGVRLEPAGAVGLAAILAGKLEPGARTLVILSGGNIAMDDFARLIESA